MVWQSDGSAANVQSIHDTQAQDGDAIMLPAGTFSWTRVVNITKGITVQGQSMTYQTGYVWFNSAYADDQTIILDDSTDGRLISMRLLPTQSGRITGITFRPGTTRNDNTVTDSTLVPQPATAQQGVADLHALLTAAKEPGERSPIGSSPRLPGWFAAS